MNFQVNVDTNGLAAELAAAAAKIHDRLALNMEMAQGVEMTVSGHLLALNSRSPHTSFYGRAARSTEATADAGGGFVTITHRGIALRYYGGRVLPVTAKNLAIPTDEVPLAGNEGRMRPREMGDLAFIPKRGGPDVTTGYLVEGEQKTITRGPRKGGTRIVPKEGGKLLYVLRAWTDHDADESVLPTTAVLLDSATASATDYLQAILDAGGLA